MPILFVVFGIGALNTSFVKDGGIVPLSYVTGTLVKMGRGIERHLAGGKVEDWLRLLPAAHSFVLGAAASGAVYGRHRTGARSRSGSVLRQPAIPTCTLTGEVGQSKRPQPRRSFERSGGN